MAATAHLTAVAPDNEKFTVRSAPARLPRRKAQRSRPQVNPAYSALHRAGTDSVQKLIPGLTAPAASFEATVGGSGCPRLVEFFKKISMNARWVPFCVEVPAA